MQNREIRATEESREGRKLGGRKRDVKEVQRAVRRYLNTTIYRE